jgi:hypothetical protein
MCVSVYASVLLYLRTYCALVERTGFLPTCTHDHLIRVLQFVYDHSICGDRKCVHIFHGVWPSGKQVGSGQTEDATGNT